jgi:hypothetical protein
MDVREGIVSYCLGFTECEHERASNSPARPEAAVYPHPPGLPRAKIRPNARRNCGRNGRKFCLAGPVTPEPPASSWPQEIFMRRAIAALLAIPVPSNGPAMLATALRWYDPVPGMPAGDG